MLVEHEQAKIEEFRKETVSVKTSFKRKSSIVLKISLIYMLLTVTNLVIFWVAMGNHQMKLISDKALLTTDKTSFDLVRRLDAVIDNKRWARQLSRGRKAAGVKMQRSLRAFQGADTLMVPFYQVVSSAGGKVVHEHGEVKAPDDAKRHRQRIINSLQHRDLKGKAFLSVANIKTFATDPSIDVYIPLSSGGIADLVFYTRIPMPNVTEERGDVLKVGLLMIIVMLVVQSLFGYVIYRMLIQPIRGLAAGAEQVSQGDLEVEVPVDKKSDELGLLMHLFNRMVGSLKEKTEKLQTTIEELEKHNEIMQNELEMAQNIQSGIMPQDSLSERIRVGVYYGPLEKVSGDYYDIFPLPDGSVGVLMTDASGHGVPAALVTIMAKVHFSSLAEKHTTPGELFEKVNFELASAITTSDYLTAFYLVIRPDLSVEYCNASHQKAMIYHHESGEIEELDTGGFFIGALDESPFPYETKTMNLQPRDRIILYTDGIVEGTNKANEEYGNDRFIEKIKENIHLSVEDFNAKIMEDVDAFAEGEPRKDDYTLFSIEIADVDVKMGDLVKQGEELYQKHDFMGAKEIFSKVMAAEPGNITAKLYLANCLFFLKEYESATPYFEEYTRIKATNPYAHLKLGVCYAKTGNEANAIAEYEKAIQINKDLAEAYGQMAISYANSGDIEIAKQNLDKALSLKPDDKRLHKIKAKIEKRMARK